jgi:hypothetical protein
MKTIYQLHRDGKHWAGVYTTKTAAEHDLKHNLSGVAGLSIVAVEVDDARYRAASHRESRANRRASAALEAEFGPLGSDGKNSDVVD